MRSSLVTTTWTASGGVEAVTRALKKPNRSPCSSKRAVDSASTRATAANGARKRRRTLRLRLPPVVGASRGPFDPASQDNAAHLPMSTDPHHLLPAAHPRGIQTVGHSLWRTCAYAPPCYT